MEEKAKVVIINEEENEDNELLDYDDENETENDNLEDLLEKIASKLKNENDKLEGYNAKAFLESFYEKLQKTDLAKACYDIGRRFQIPPKRLADSFYQSILGTIGDTLGIVIKVTKNVFDTLINTLHCILNGAMNIIIKVSDAIIRLFTLNYTCQR